VAEATGAIFRTDTPQRGLFDDRRARNVGDTITVVLQETGEQFQAGWQQIGARVLDRRLGRHRQRAAAEDLQGLQFTASENKSADNSGSSTQSGAFTGTIATTVAEVLPNGNLLVSGDKQIQINYGVQHLRFSGIVNPVNVRPENTIQSTAVANARLEYREDGAIGDNAIIGGLMRLFIKAATHFLRPIACAPPDSSSAPDRALMAFDAAAADRVKDLMSVQGVRGNQLVGYGLVVGLDGTGDQTTQTPFTIQTITSMLSNLGVQLPPGINPQLRNVAAVMATASLPAYAKPGQLIDITVSSMGNARSLRGGTLLLTPLKGADGQIWTPWPKAACRVGGAGAASVAPAPRSITFPPVASRVAPPSSEQCRPRSVRATPSSLRRRAPTSPRSRASPRSSTRPSARVSPVRRDGRQVRWRHPPTRLSGWPSCPGWRSPITAGEAAPKVVMNARTGSVVMNQLVTLAPCAVSHGNLTVSVQTQPQVSQPNALGAGQTVTTEQARVEIKSDQGKVISMPAAPSLNDVVRALNAVGATPQDLLGILQAMKSAGALKADLEIILMARSAARCCATSRRPARPAAGGIAAACGRGFVAGCAEGGRAAGSRPSC
jgi:flagellar P-ring protein precursor FlgI